MIKIFNIKFTDEEKTADILTEVLENLGDDRWRNLDKKLFINSSMNSIRFDSDGYYIGTDDKNKTISVKELLSNHEAQNIDDDELDKTNTLKEWIKKQLLDIERDKDSYMMGYKRALKDMIIEIERVENE